MSGDEDLELQALERQLDDAFETTRPRHGFEDELWLRMQSRRPLWTRLQDSVAGLLRAIREAPAVPAAAVAAVLVVVIGAGIVALGGFGHGGASSSSVATRVNPQSGGAFLGEAGAFGRVPAPALSPGQPGAAAIPVQSGDTSAQPAGQAPANLYFGPATLTWTGQLNLAITTAPVFRYREPSTAVADQFATSLGASVTSRPAGYIGSYTSTDFTLRVRGTVQLPPHEPAYLIRPILSAPPANAGSPTDAAKKFLVEHSLGAQWPITLDVVLSGDVTAVRWLRQFEVAGSGVAGLVDSNGEPYGLEVDLKGGQVVLVAGPLPLSFDSSDYRVISADQAVASALASAPSQPKGPNPPPAVQLTRAELVYALVAAGDHSFYEPAVLFSGTFVMNGATYTKRVLVPAVDPSQRSS